MDEDIGLSAIKKLEKGKTWSQNWKPDIFSYRIQRPLSHELGLKLNDCDPSHVIEAKTSVLLKSPYPRFE